MTQATSSGYLKTLTLCTAIGVLGVAGFNLLMDPFLFYESPRIVGFNYAKPNMGNFERQIKAYAIERREAKGLIFGASNSDSGLRPRHPGWTATPVYSLALGASTMSMSNQFYRHAADSQQPEEMVIGLSLSMFNGSRNADFDSSIMAYLPDGSPNPDFQPLSQLSTIFSASTFKSSLRALYRNLTTYRNPSDELVIPVDEDGYMDPAVFPKNAQTSWRFRFLNNSVAYIDRWWAPVDSLSLTDEYGGESTEIRAFRLMVRDAYKKDITLHLMFSPAHVYLQEILDAIGLYETTEDLRRTLMRVNLEEAELAGKPPFELWDFFGYNTVNTEKVANSIGPEYAPEWFWDAGHYKPELGDRILNTLFDGTEYEDFGVRLTPGSIEAHLAEQRQRRRDYRSRNAEDVEKIRAAARRKAGLE